MHSFHHQYNGPMYFERQYNLVYIFSNPEDDEKSGTGGGGFWGKRSSVSKSAAAQYQNILIYDIPKELQLWFFSPGELAEDEFVSNLVFEQHYDDKYKNMAFSSHIGPVVVNNFDLMQRPVSDRIMVLTTSESKSQSKLWISDKWGFEKKVLASIAKESFWQIDAYNAVVRVMEKEKNGQFNIQSFDY